MSESAMQVWEYCDFLVTEVFGPERIEDETPAEREEEELTLAIQGVQRSAIAQAGLNGWELIGVVPLMLEGTTRAERYVFKRPKR